MRNKLLAALLTLCMVMTLLPATVFADGSVCSCGCAYDGPFGGCCTPAVEADPANGVEAADAKCGCAEEGAAKCNNPGCQVCYPNPQSCPEPGCVMWDSNHEGLHQFACKCPDADCTTVHHNGSANMYYEAAAEDPEGRCPGCRPKVVPTECLVCGCLLDSCDKCEYHEPTNGTICGCGGPEKCTCGKDSLAPEGHCLCTELNCTARGHVGGSNGMTCVIVPENGETLCDDCLAYAASKDGGSQDNGKKDGEQKPTTPAADPSAPKKAEDFSDVDAGMWYNDDLTTMLEKGWFVGQAGGKFAPQTATTGAEVVVILSRVAGEDLVTTGSGWNVAATEWAAKEGITDGIEITTSGTLARQDLILMLWRAAGKPASTRALDFTDVGGVSGDALTALRWAVEKGIVKGNGDGTVSPNGATKRCEMAALMVRYDQAVKG